MCRRITDKDLNFLIHYDIKSCIGLGGGDMFLNDVKHMSDKEILDELQAIGISQINWTSSLKNGTGG